MLEGLWNHGGMHHETQSAEELKKLAEELSQLSQQHQEALESAAFVGVSELDSKEYHERRSRIGKLCELLGKFRLPNRVGGDDDPEPA
jgi:response regulator RpfG family c-di-GMP phosphodiesterase